MTVLERHAELNRPIWRIELKPPEEPPEDRRRVRWIAWSFSILVLAAAVIAAFVLSDSDSFAELYEAESPLAYGAVHQTGFEVGSRWVGESGPTLEEFETLRAYESSVGGADRVLGRYMVEPGFTPGELAALQASTGEADRVLMRSNESTSPRWFTSEELAALQASVGAADLKYLNMASTG